jgi:hypothetical protein
MTTKHRHPVYLFFVRYVKPAWEAALQGRGCSEIALLIALDVMTTSELTARELSQEAYLQKVREGEGKDHTT